MLVIAGFFLSTTYTSGQQIEIEKFKVYGNCGMCKKTIEGGLNGEEGIKYAKWNVETKIIKVKFDATLISLVDIKKKIAAVGYDTEEERANEEVYNGLHKCCQYARPVAIEQ